MFAMKRFLFLLAVGTGLFAQSLVAGDEQTPCGGTVSIAEMPEEWQLKSPRDEIAAKGSRDPEQKAWILEAENREGIDGFWEKIFSVEGGKSYRFFALRKASEIDHERRSCVVRIEWEDEKGSKVESPHRVNPAYFGSDTTAAQPDFPRDKEMRNDGWRVVEDVYQAPEKAVRAVVQLHLRWAPGGKVTWKNVTFAESEPLPSRKVKLAAVHFNLPGSGTAPFRK